MLFLTRFTAMQSRKLHGLIAFALFLVAAVVYAALSGKPVDLWRVALWSMIGVGSYMALSRLFGFDPHRTRIAECAPRVYALRRSLGAAPGTGDAIDARRHRGRCPVCSMPSIS